MSYSLTEIPALDKGVVDFLKAQTVLTLAVSQEDQPYVASCFYTFMDDCAVLVFKSDPDTTHMQMARANTKVAGSILPDKLEKTKIMGIQFTGELLLNNAELEKQASSHYHGKYPFARVVPGTIWMIRIDKLKMTNNTLGFGKKITWQR